MYFFLFNVRYLYTNWYLVPNQVFFLLQKAICSENIPKLFPRPKWLIAKGPTGLIMQLQKISLHSYGSTDYLLALFPCNAFYHIKPTECR